MSLQRSEPQLRGGLPDAEPATHQAVQLNRYQDDHQADDVNCSAKTVS
jgi:hypothetical protein